MMREAGPGEEQALDGFLSDHSAFSMFLRGNLAAHGLRGSDHPHATRFWIWPETGPVRAVLGLTNSGMVMCQCPDGPPSCFAEVMRRERLSGFSGEAAQSAALIAALGLAAEDFRLNHVEPLFRLDLARLPGGDDRIRPARPGDEGWLTEWFAAYMEETGLGAGDRAAGVAEARDRADAAVTPESPVRVLIRGGRPVAMAGLNARTGTAVQVGGVFVPPAARNRGLGRAVTRALLAEMREGGATEAVLFSNNDAASAAYRALGFVQVGWYRIAFLAAAGYRAA